MRRYLTALAATIVALLGVVVAINYLVDPFGLWRPAQQWHRAGIWWYPRLALPLHANLIPPKTVIFGSSRARDGIDPAYLSALGEPVMNYGVSGLVIHEAEEYVGQLARLGTVKTVLIGADFFWFNGTVRARPGFESELLMPGISPYNLVRVLSSRLALWNSYTSLTEDELVLPSGFHVRQPTPAIGSAILNSAVGFHLAPSLYGGYGDLEASYAAFDRMLATLTSAGVQVKIFMSPEHAAMTELFYLRGFAPQYEGWKRRVVEISAGHGVPVWDFSGFNSITTTDLSIAGDRYFDGSHYTPRIGCLILHRIEASSCIAQEPLPDDFGVKLDPATISPYLDAQKMRQHAYEEDQPDTLAKLRALALQSNLRLPPG